MTVVEIPPGSGNRYKYVYEGGKTVYKGPVGTAPEISEGEFLEMMERSGMNPRVKTDLEALSIIAKDVDIETAANMFVAGEYFSSMGEAKDAASALKAYGHNGIKRAEMAAQAALNEVIGPNFEEYEFDDGRAEYWIETVASGSAGTYMPGEVISEFEGLFPEKELEDYIEGPGLSPGYGVQYGPEVWGDLIEPTLDRVAGGLNNLTEFSVPDGYSAQFFFGNSEADGDYGLQLIIEKSD